MAFCNFFHDEFFIGLFPIALFQKNCEDTKFIANAPWFLSPICNEHEGHTLTLGCFH
jgi:hypothetical protein